MPKVECLNFAKCGNMTVVVHRGFVNHGASRCTECRAEQRREYKEKQRAAAEERRQSGPLVVAHQPAMYKFPR